MHFRANDRLQTLPPSVPSLTTPGRSRIVRHDLDVVAPIASNPLLQALAEHDFSGQDEQAIREQWIYPILMLLGYGVGTPNGVEIPFKVPMRPPLRTLGSTRWEIDYLPTVHNVGLWIIEAKRPDDDLFSELHLAQAWGYATHPRVDVPFMVLANGTRLRVFDLTKDDWDVPILDIQQSELATRFAELEAVLGARRVAEFVRRRQLRHLGAALNAQLDDNSLDQTLDDVAALVRAARPAVRANRAKVTSAAWAEWLRTQSESARAIGMLGIAIRASSLNSPIGLEIETCVKLIEERPVDERAGALDEILSVARVGDTVRQTFSFRVLRFAVALRLVGVEGCDAAARRVAAEIARDAAENFPDAPLEAAAHEFERVLSAFLGRFVLVEGTEAAKTAAEHARRTLDVERYLREEVLGGLAPETRLSWNVDLLFRLIWTHQSPWTVSVLQAGSRELREALDKMPPPPPDLRIGQIGNPNCEMHLAFDPLVPGMRNVLRQVADPGPGTEDAVTEASRQLARELLDRHFSAESGDAQQNTASP